MKNNKESKAERILSIYTKLMNGDILNKAKLAQEYGVNARSIQRDIDDIRACLVHEGAITGDINSIIYDRMKNGYNLERVYEMKLSNSEVPAISKILLDSGLLQKRNEFHVGEAY